jgi:hypothetical protein
VDRDLPAGTVSFLFTDVEVSTRLLQELGAAIRFGITCPVGAEGSICTRSRSGRRTTTAVNAVFGFAHLPAPTGDGWGALRRLARKSRYQ